MIERYDIGDLARSTTRSKIIVKVESTNRIRTIQSKDVFLGRITSTHHNTPSTTSTTTTTLFSY